MSQAPRWWLSAGAGVFLLSVLVGYHQEQIAANSVLAGKVGTPPLVQIQDYDPGMHSNMLREVQLLGEAATGQAVLVDLGSEGSPRLVEVVPVYPVSAAATPMALWYLRSVYDAVRRPMPRSAAPALAEMERGLKAMEHMAVGLLISEGRVEDDLNVVGAGVNGPLVTIFGAETGGGQIPTLAGRALSGRGIELLEDLPVIALYAGGARPASPIKDFTASRRIFDLLALAFVLIGIAKAVPPLRFRFRRSPETFEEVQAVGEFPGVFEPIRTQEDLIREEQDAEEKKAAATRRVLSRMV